MAAAHGPPMGRRPIAEMLPHHLVELPVVGKIGRNLDTAVDPLLRALEAGVYAEASQNTMLVVPAAQVLLRPPRCIKLNER